MGPVLVLQNFSPGSLGLFEYLLVMALIAGVCLGPSIVAIADLARTPDAAFQEGMARSGWIATIAILTILTVVGGISVALWWLLVARRRIEPHRI
jgi:hypothetical protein